ncbi:MAG: gamma-glutamyl-gamma-aminobutyrate hydrolase family protein [Actinomycetota bacterium]
MSHPALIGLVGRRIKASAVVGWPEILHPLDADLYLAGYASGVMEAGGLPVHLPVDIDPEAIMTRLDGLLLTGGADIDPARYGAAPDPDLTPLERERDDLEFALFEAAVAADVPVLGVCRGLQVINVAQGGSLHQHVPEHLRIDVPFTDAVQEVTTVEGSRLHALYGPSVAVNSLHHQTVDRVGHDITVTARADDGVVEGLELGDRIVAVQWHPEMMLSRPDDPAIHWLVETAAAGD